MVMLEFMGWNFLILVIVSALAGFFAPEGQRWLYVQVYFYVGLFFSCAFWFVAMAVKVAGQI